jgi:diguanylate cyclase (GGDEF)-like protein
LKLDPIDVADLPLDQETDRLHSRYFSRLRFPPALETVFNLSTAAARAQSMATQGWIMTATYCLLILVDFFSIHARFHTALIVRCGIVLPLLILSKFIVSRNPPALIRESALLFASQLAAFGTFFLYRHEPMDAVAGTQVVTIVVLLGISVVLRFRFPFAGNTAFLFANPNLSATNQISWSLALTWAACFTLTAGFSLERQERLNFLYQLRNQAQSSALTAANTELQRLAERDALTGIANRAAFDQRFAALCSDVRSRSAPLSAILIDIDHFKRINDTHGHLYGDQVLKRVASLITQSLRGRNDFAARFGGEEFVILLPETGRHAACKIAERLRAMVEIAGSPATDDPTEPALALWTTVSCGVATIEADAPCTRRHLLHAADTALYAAKAAGRNRVHLAPHLGNCTSLTPHHRNAQESLILSAAKDLRI